MLLFCASDPGAEVQMMPFKNQPSQSWRLVGNYVMKNNQECLDIARSDMTDGAGVISYQYQGSVNQRWHLEYV